MRASIVAATMERRVKSGDDTKRERISVDPLRLCASVVNPTDGSDGTAVIDRNDVIGSVA
jgi:hypothetical protein